MNEIYLNNNISNTENIEDIATTCVLLALKFNNCRKLDENLRSFKKYVNKNVENWKFLEVKCLGFLDYNLGKYSSYDYLILFFGMGIIFKDAKYLDIFDNFQQSEKILEIVTNDIRLYNYSQFIIALSIIYYIFENDYAFDLYIFKYIYGVDFSKIKYINCIKTIKLILSNFLSNKHFTYTFNNINNYFINNLTDAVSYIKMITEDGNMKETEKKNKKRSTQIKINYYDFN